jgi:transcriptional regulator with XRE-family HTH domain
VINLLKKLRENKGLSLRKLAKISGVSKTYLADMENNPNICNPSFNFIFKLEKSLDLEPGEIYLYFVYCRKNKVEDS